MNEQEEKMYKIAWDVISQNKSLEINKYLISSLYQSENAITFDIKSIFLGILIGVISFGFYLFVALRLW